MTRRDLGHRERLDWLRPARAEAVGPVTFNRLIGRFGSPAKALAGRADLLPGGMVTGVFN